MCSPTETKTCFPRNYKGDIITDTHVGLCYFPNQIYYVCPGNLILRMSSIFICEESGTIMIC